MKKVQKGFTLVELIVVITILAILGTIAFISLQGYSQDAKNAKVGSDLATLAKTVDIATTDGTITISRLVDVVSGTGNRVDTSDTITLFDSENNSTTGALADVTYQVGTIDFAALRQNGDDFKDPEGNDYIAAAAFSGATSYFQLAGQKKENSGAYTAIVKGNYIAQTGDAESLVSATGASTAVKNNHSFSTAPGTPTFTKILP